MTTRLGQFARICFWAGICLLCSGAPAYSQSATDIYGLYYTGVDNNYGLIAGGSTEPAWQVTYARVAGTSYKSTYSATGNPTTTAYTGDAYVITPSLLPSQGYIQNTGSAQWITAPGAIDPNSGLTNTGGNFLPGNGNTGNNEGIYVYTLAFTIAGTGNAGTTVSNHVSISLTIAADDQYSVYVNPVLNNNGSIRTNRSTLGGSNLYSANPLNQPWTNTQTLTLQNFGSNANANFVIGTNYLVIEVDNTNSVIGSSSATTTNASGLLVYQVGSAMSIDGHVVPEKGTCLPIVGALGLFGWCFLFRRKGPEDRPAGAPSM